MKEKNETPWMVTLPTASKMSGIPYHWLRELVKKGELPAYKAGDRNYVNVEELKEVLKTVKMH